MFFFHIPFKIFGLEDISNIWVRTENINKDFHAHHPALSSAHVAVHFKYPQTGLNSCVEHKKRGLSKMDSMEDITVMSTCVVATSPR